MFGKKKNLSKKPIPKGFYAWTSLHAGSFILFVEQLKDCYKFIFLPGPSYMYLTFDTFSGCITNKILEFVETLPDEIYNETISIAENNVDVSSVKFENINNEI